MITKHQGKTVYLVDDDFAVRDSLSIMIQSTGLSVKCFDSAQAFLDNYESKQLGCLVLDFLMPTMNGLDLQEELKKRNIIIPIIFISGHGNIPISSKAFRNGAIDFLEKPLDAKLLLERINETLNQAQLNWEKQCINHEVMVLYSQLSTREKEVMKLIAESYSNKEAARTLGISNRTIEVHRARVMEKMEADNLADLIVKAVSCGVIHV
ncbi:MAG: response regulator [Methylococcaceae bacterium]|nr:response regulator [Methylococcaceae bacterium]